MNAGLRNLLLCALLVPGAAAANQDVERTIHVPGVLTDAGERFISECSDRAFARTSDARALATRCDALLARWHQQAELKVLRQDNPRVRAVAQMADRDDRPLPYDHIRSGVFSIGSALAAR